MRDKNVFSFRASLPRMSWSPENLYNLWKRSLGVRAREAIFTKAKTTLFQQRWLSKKLLRAYHGDYIKESSFKRWYLPALLPDVRNRVKDASASLLNFAGRKDDLDQVKRLQEDEAEQAHAPVSSLMWTEIERRIDTVIFRACLTHSVYSARELVLHGHVKLNGRIYTDPNTRLAPGDMVTVNPDAIQILSQGQPIMAPWRIEPVVWTAQGAKAKTNDTASSAPNDNSTSPANSTASTSSSSNSTPSYRPPRDFKLPEFAAPFIFVPAYLEVSFVTCSVVYIRHPTARAGYSEIPTPYDADGEIMRLAWEFYSDRRPRVRGKTNLAGMPTNRQGQWVFKGIKRPKIPSPTAEPSLT